MASTAIVALTGMAITVLLLYPTDPELMSDLNLGVMGGLVLWGVVIHALRPKLLENRWASTGPIIAFGLWIAAGGGFAFALGAETMVLRAYVAQGLTLAGMGGLIVWARGSTPGTTCTPPPAEGSIAL